MGFIWLIQTPVIFQPATFRATPRRRKFEAEQRVTKRVRMITRMHEKWGQSPCTF